MHERTAPSADPSTLLVQLLSGGRAGKWKEIAGWSVAGASLAVKARSKYKEWKTEREFSVSVTEQDDIYNDVQQWVLDRIPAQERRALLAFTGRSLSDTVGPEPRRELRLGFDGAKSQTVSIDGNPVTVSVTKREYGRQDTGMWGEPARITFVAKSRSGRDAAVRFLSQVADEYERGRNGSSLYVATSWGGWQRANDAPPRPIHSVVLRGTQREELISDLVNFMSHEESYTSLGIPWHRGYLLHGPPGTGKTSIARALAGHVGLDIYYMSLGDLNSDTNLIQLLTGLEPRSMLLLEDIDIAHSATVRDDTTKGVSLSGLLQALDGVVTPHGLITVMTTNKVESLDEALVRTGRADKTVLIDHIDNDQLVRLVDVMAPGEIQPDWPSLTTAEVTPAEVVEMAKPHLDDTSAIVAAIHQGLTERIRHEKTS